MELADGARANGWSRPTPHISRALRLLPTKLSAKLTKKHPFLGAFLLCGPYRIRTGDLLIAKGDLNINIKKHLRFVL